MDEFHLYVGARYIDLNPVRAGLVKEPWDYRWSSAAAHVNGKDDMLVSTKQLLERFGDWREYLAVDISSKDIEKIELHERTGCPLGDESFLFELEDTLGQNLRLQKTGPKGPRKVKKETRENE